jgi:hypothetical protein
MPQVVFSPTSQNDTTLNELAFRGMSENLAENIKYRRSQQSRKAATAQDLEAKMAAGLIPKSALKVTDEGFEFKDQEAKSAFYDKLGSMFGKDDKSRKGFTTSQIDPNADATNSQRYREGVSAAIESAKGSLEAQGVAAKTAEMFNAAKDLQFTGPTPTDEPDAAQDNAAKNAAMINNMVQQGQQGNLQAMQQSLQQALQANNLLGQQTAAMQQQQVGNVAALSGQGPNITSAVTAPGGNVPGPVNTKQTQKTQVKTGNTGSGASSAISEMDQIQAAYESPGYKYKQDDYALKTTSTQSERIDEIKTSLTNLLGLSAFENYGNQLLKVNDQNINAPVNNTFGAMSQQRAADILRWEQAGTKDGTTQEYEKVGERSTEVTPAKYSINAVRKDALKQQQNIMIGGNTLSTGAVTTTGNQGGAADNKNALAALKDASGREVAGSFDPQTNTYSFAGSTISGSNIDKWVKSAPANMIQWEKSNKPGYAKFKIKGTTDWFEGKRDQATGDYIDVTGNLSNSRATTIFQNLQAGKLGTGASSLSNAQDAANLSNTAAQTQQRLRKP